MKSVLLFSLFLMTVPLDSSKHARVLSSYPVYHWIIPDSSDATSDYTVTVIPKQKGKK